MDVTAGQRTGYLESRQGVAGPWSAAINGLFADCDAAGQPGLNLAVIRDGRIVHRRGYGVANVEDDTPFRPDTVLHLGSTTKHMCASCVLAFEDRGLLGLDDPITRWVDDLPAFFQGISLRHLLTMTSGLPDGLNAGLFSGTGSGVVAQAGHMEVLKRLEGPMFPPGAGTTYSNSNYLLLSRALERAGGAPLAELMRRELFAPLGMASTFLLPDAAVATPDRARGYAIDAQGRARTQPAMVELCGDGGVVTTLTDMAAWAEAYAAGRPAQDFRRRLEAEARLPDGAATGYALGMGVGRVLGLAKVSHGGGMPGYLADFAYLPDAGIFVVWLANRMDPGLFERTDRIMAILLDRSPDEVPAAGVHPELAKLKGVYVNREVGCTAEFEVTPAGTLCHVLGERLVPERVGPGLFRPTKASACYPFRIGAVDGRSRPNLEMKLSTSDWVTFHPWDEAEAADVVPADYVGDYRNVAFGETHQVRLAGDGLEVTIGSAARALLWRVLKPRGGDLFSAVIPGEPSDTDVTLIFRRDAAGRVTGFCYNLSRNRDVDFIRQDAPS